MRLKIRGGTARSDEPSLCLTCRHATIIRGKNLDDEIVDCACSTATAAALHFP